MTAVAAWLATGVPVAGIVYWAFLNTPESNAVMLAASGLLLLVLVLVIALVGTVAVLLALGDSLAASIRQGVRRGHWFAVTAVPVVGAAWAIGYADTWVARHSGELGAWFIATFGWADITPLLRAERWVSAWLRWVVVPAAAVAAVAALVRPAAPGVARGAWLRAAWHWRTLLATTTAFVLLMVLPWRLAFWRPTGLPPTWIQPALAGLRLLLVAAAMALGAAIFVVTCARATQASRIKSS